MIGRSPFYVLSISRNYGGLILLTALQTTITKKVEIFFLRFWNLNSSGVDFFVQNVGNENCLVVPPVIMITKAIHYLYAVGRLGQSLYLFGHRLIFGRLSQESFGSTSGTLLFASKTWPRTVSRKARQRLIDRE